MLHPNQCQTQAYQSASLFCLSVRLLFSVVRPVKEMRLSLVRITQRRGGNVHFRGRHKMQESLP